MSSVDQMYSMALLPTARNTSIVNKFSKAKNRLGEELTKESQSSSTHTTSTLDMKVQIPMF